MIVHAKSSNRSVRLTPCMVLGNRRVVETRHSPTAVAFLPLDVQDLRGAEILDAMAAQRAEPNHNDPAWDRVRKALPWSRRKSR